MLCIIDIRAAFCSGPSMKTDPARRGATMFYESLRSQYQMIALSPEDPTITRWWLRKEHMMEWSLIKCWDKDWPLYIEWSEHIVADFLSSGWEIGLYIDTYEPSIRRVQDMHVTTLQISYPEIGPGFYDPEKPPRAWASVAGDPGGDHGLG